MRASEKGKLLFIEMKLVEAEAGIKTAMRLPVQSYQQRQRRISGALFAVKAALREVQDMLPKKESPFKLPHKNGA